MIVINKYKKELFVKPVIKKIKERTILTLYPQIKILKTLTIKHKKKLITKTTTLMF